MAVTALVGSGVEVMAEVADYGAAAVLEGQVGRLVAHMALVTVTGSSKGCLAIMAAATGFTFDHISHGGLAGPLAVVILLGVAVAALVYLDVEIMAEYGITDRLGLVLEGFCSQTAVTGTTVCCCRKRSFTIVAYAA